jgi:hypothetical protein
MDGCLPAWPSLDAHIQMDRIVIRMDLSFLFSCLILEFLRTQAEYMFLNFAVIQKNGLDSFIAHFQRYMN